MDLIVKCVFSPSESRWVDVMMCFSARRAVRSMTRRRTDIKNFNLKPLSGITFISCIIITAGHRWGFRYSGPLQNVVVNESVSWFPNFMLLTSRKVLSQNNPTLAQLTCWNIWFTKISNIGQLTETRNFQPFWLMVFISYILDQLVHQVYLTWTENIPKVRVVLKMSKNVAKLRREWPPGIAVLWPYTYDIKRLDFWE